LRTIGQKRIERIRDIYDYARHKFTIYLLTYLRTRKLELLSIIMHSFPCVVLARRADATDVVVHSHNVALIMMYGWFGIAVTAFVTSTKLCYVEPGYYWNW